MGAESSDKIMVIVPAGVRGVNVREKPSLDSKILTYFWVTTRTNRLGETDGWTKIEIEVEKEGKKYTEGWVSSQLVKEVKE